MTDYTASGQPFAGSRGLSSPIRVEFANIQTAVNSKANIDSPAFTGTPTAPTPTTGDSSTKIATTAFVAATAFSSVLPAQLGNAGKFLQTNGTVASWQEVYPAQAGNSGKFLTTNGTTTSWVDQVIPPPKVRLSVE